MIDIRTIGNSASNINQIFVSEKAKSILTFKANVEENNAQYIDQTINVYILTISRHKVVARYDMHKTFASLLVYYPAIYWNGKYENTEHSIENSVHGFIAPFDIENS